MDGYIFGGEGLPKSPKELERMRKLARSMAPSRTPRNIGEGLDALGKAFLVRSMTNKADKAEKAGATGASDSFNAVLKSMLGGGGGGGVPKPQITAPTPASNAVPTPQGISFTDAPQGGQRPQAVATPPVPQGGQPSPVAPQVAPSAPPPPAAQASPQPNHMATLAAALGNPHMNEGQRSVLEAMMKQRMGTRQDTRDNEQWRQRFDLQNQHQNQQLDRRFAQQNSMQQSQLAGRQQIAETTARGKASTAGKFYAVQTGNGIMLLDKATGTAVMMGQDEQGNPVQIGNPFRPAFDPQTNQPVAAPTPEMIAGQATQGAPAQNHPLQSPPPQLPQGGGQQAPLGQSSLGQPQGSLPGQPVPSQPPQGVTPLMSPSIDPRAQENVRRAQKIGELAGKREGSRPERLKATNASLNQFTSEYKIVREDIGRAIELANEGWATGAGSIMSGIPGTNAHNLQAMLGSIKAKVGFDKLQNMRDSSITGGALGQVTEREISLLQAVFGSLEQSQTKEQFVYNMNRLDAVLQKSHGAIMQAYETDYGTAYQPESTGLGEGPRDVQDLLEKYGGPQ